ncbi:MAG: hypothetical protein HYR84_10325 [Planctomycetes bacterium]|nr:hypothetical protein [Planctomycetota bacterium]
MRTLSSTSCQSASTAFPVVLSDDPFSQMIVLDYYDGPAGGLLKCRDCSAEYYFYLLDCDSMNTLRIFALAPMRQSSFEELCRLFKATPDQHVWIPPWPTDDDLAELYDKGIKNVTDRAGTPTLVIAWSVGAERTLAMRGVDFAAANHLSPWFERQPHPVVFDWFSYLRVVGSQQSA